MRYITIPIFIVFLFLKLAGIGIVASWSWWYVFSPLLIHLLLVIFGIIIYAIGKRIEIEETAALENKRPKSAWEIKLNELKEKQK